MNINQYSSNWIDTFLNTINPKQTEFEIDTIQDFLSHKEFNSILDLACGSGRHSVELAKRGKKVLGIDNNESLILKAKENKYNNLSFQQADFNNFNFPKKEFDLVISMWASFGFGDDHENNKLLENIFHSLTESGSLFLDIYNSDFFHQTLERRRTHQKNGIEVIEEKRINNERLDTYLTYPNGHQDHFSWRLYSKDEMTSLLRNLGFNKITVIGAYKEHLNNLNQVPRLQYICEKTS